MNGLRSNSKDDLVEALAKIEHDQWRHWSEAAAVDVSDATQEKWRNSWVEYDELPESIKEADRIWARKVVKLLQQRRLIPTTTT